MSSRWAHAGAPHRASRRNRLGPAHGRPKARRVELNSVHAGVQRPRDVRRQVPGFEAEAGARFALSSVPASCAAMSLFELPSAIRRSTRTYVGESRSWSMCSPVSQRVTRNTLSGAAWPCERRTLNAGVLCIAFIPDLLAACRRSASS